MTMSNNIVNGQFGDTTLTKVFVGGLAWETPKEAMREHFDKYGDILEAVIISDKLTGRSKGYGFVTFKDAEAAKKACEDATPVINGRRANCNLASLGARRPRSSTTTPPPQGGNGGARSAANHVQWYYPAAGSAAASPYPHHQPLPFYGNGAMLRYSPTYIATDVTYNHKVGGYMNGHYSQVYPGGGGGGGGGGQGIMGGNTLMPMYPLYHIHQSHTMGLPAHIFPPSPIPTLIAKPASISPPPGTVGKVEGLKKVV